MANPQSLAGRSYAASTPIDARALMRIKDLQLRARLVVEGFLNGLHRSPFHGFSAEFSEYRPYTIGDDPRYVDWRLYARCDRHYVKRFEDETNLRCYMVVDRSRSMGYGSQGFTKADYAVTLAATLGYFLIRQHDAVGALTFDEQVGAFLPARNRPGHFRRLLATIDSPLGGAASDITRPLERIGRLAPRRAMMVLLSDMLLPIEELETRLGRLAARGHELIVFQLMDPAERDFTFDAAMTFQDMETGQEMYVDPDAAREEYLRRFRAHSDAVKATCDKLGASFLVVGVDQPLEKCLADFLHARSKRGVRVPLRRSITGGVA